MIVQQIMKSKAAGGVATIAPAAGLDAAVAAMAERRIGALVVSRTGADVEGIVSERDIVRELAARGPACLGRTVGEVMTRTIVTCAPADTAQSVLERMTAGRFRHMPVLEGGEMVGLISIGDVVKARLDELGAEMDALEGMIKGF
ncbi:MAG: CBS domain-containing protein [Gemmobacter sp.]